MLETIRERAQGWVAKAILVLIAVPFALFGLDSYFQGNSKAPSVAEVDGTPITVTEFEQALQPQIQQLRQMMGGQFDENAPMVQELRQRVLQGMINDHLLALQAREENYLTSDEILGSYIAQIPAFQENGKFSERLYVERLRQQGMTPASFQAALQREIQASRMYEDIIRSAIVTRAQADRIAGVLQQQREVSLAMLQNAAFMASAAPTPAEVSAYYAANKQKFQRPEQVKIDYLVLSQEQIMQSVAVSDDEVKQYYAAHKGEFTEPEERRARHILVAFPATATEADKKAALAKAQAIHQQVVQNPERFAELAREQSEDPGSKAAGGDLGFFGRGQMVKPFEDAVFSLQKGAISAPVASDFGYHVIQLLEVRGGQQKSLEEVASEIRTRLQQEKANRQFNEAAEAFGNKVYEQSESLAPAASQFKLTVQRSDWISRSGNNDPLLGNPKLVQAIFSDEVLKDQRNTEAVQVAPGVLVAARLAEHRPAATLPLVEVKPAIERELSQQKAQSLAKAAAERALTQLRAGQDAGINFTAPRTVSRSDPQDLPEAVLTQLFSMPAKQLPSYATVAVDGGYAVLRLNRVDPGAPLDETNRKQMAEQLKRITGDEQMRAYLEVLKAKYPVTITDKRLAGDQVKP